VASAATVRRRAATRPRSDDTADKMIVSNWYTDELGNQARFVTARD
jgi:hypothetical protein